MTASSLEVVERGSKSITKDRNDPWKYSLEAPSLKRSFISQQATHRETELLEEPSVPRTVGGVRHHDRR